MIRLDRFSAWLFALLCVITPGFAEGGSVAPGPAHAQRMPTITILYDNNPHRAGMESAWGFSCLVQGMEKNVLFDTGGDGRLLLSNMKKLGLAPQEIDAAVISHIHGDHAAGLKTLLKRNKRLVAYLPASFPECFLREVKTEGVRVVPVREGVQICADAFSTGELGTTPREQALVLRTARGLVIVTGCAHPGIEKIVRTAREQFKGEVLLVLGGFHLGKSGDAEVARVIAGLQKLGVRHVAPCHCTGEAARKLFQQAFGTNFIHAGVGTVISTEGLR